MRRVLLNLAVALALSSSAAATVYLVNPDGTGDFPTIQEGIWACSEGDTVELGDGVFTGNWNRLIDFMGMAITVRSRSGDPEACVIDIEADVDNQRFAVVFHYGEGPESRLEGLTITGGFDLGC
jgi:hypothetical protein